MLDSFSNPENPPPYSKEKIQIGPTIPKPKEKGGATKKPPQKSQAKKKDKDEKPIKWDGMPQQRPQMAMENVLDVRNALENQDAKDDEDSGTMSEIEVAPELIKEVTKTKMPSLLFRSFILLKFQKKLRHT